MKYAAILILISFALACTPSVSYRPLLTETFPPNVSVEVFTDSKPDRPYAAIGQIVVDEGARNGREMMKVAVDKAKAIGADAIILTSAKPQIIHTTYGYREFGGGVTRYKGGQWSFLAVRWK